MPANGSPDLGPPSARLTRALKGLQFNPRSAAMAGVSADVARSAGADLPQTPGTSAADEFMSRMRSPSVADRISMGLEAAAPIFNPRSESTGQAFVGSALQAFAGGQQIQRSSALNSLLLQMQMARAGLDAARTQALTQQAQSRARWLDTEAAGGGPAAVEGMRETAAGVRQKSGQDFAASQQEKRLAALKEIATRRGVARTQTVADRELAAARARYQPAAAAAIREMNRLVPDEGGGPGDMRRQTPAEQEQRRFAITRMMDPATVADSSLLAGSGIPRGVTPTRENVGPLQSGFVRAAAAAPAAATAPAPALAIPGVPLPSVGGPSAGEEISEAPEGPSEDTLKHLGQLYATAGMGDDEIEEELTSAGYEPEHIQQVQAHAAGFRTPGNEGS